MRKYSYYVVAIVIAGILWYLEPRRHTPKIDQPTPAPTSLATPTAAPVPTAGPTPLVARPVPKAATPKIQDTLVELLPVFEDVRGDVKADPHTAPASGKRFALELARRAREAETSEDKSAQFMDELDACASSRDPKKMNPGTQALCLQVARNLQHRYPVLKTKLEELFRHAEPNAAAIANQIP